MVAIMLIAVPMLPIPEDSSESVQKSVLCPTENVFAVIGSACAYQETGWPIFVGAPAVQPLAEKEPNKSAWKIRPIQREP
jgi:hypothetical protein